MKKGLDKRERIWYLRQAVREGGSKTEYGGAETPGSPKKKFKKFLKKGLTNAGKSAILSLVPLRRRAPCKLNNVTKRKRYTKRGSVKFHKAGANRKGNAGGKWNGNRAFKKFRRRGLVNYLTTERDRLLENEPERKRECGKVSGIRRRKAVENEAMTNSSIKVYARRAFLYNKGWAGRMDTILLRV